MRAVGFHPGFGEGWQELPSSKQLDRSQESHRVLYIASFCGIMSDSDRPQLT